MAIAKPKHKKSVNQKWPDAPFQLKRSGPGTKWLGSGGSKGKKGK